MNAECMIIKNQENSIDEDSKKIYGGWLLHQTLKNIPDIIKLPVDIPELVEKVYSTEFDEVKDEEKSLWLEYGEHIAALSGKAKEFCIKAPSESKNLRINTIEGLLDTSVSVNSDAEAAVRDGDGTIEVILMVRKSNGNISWFPWQSKKIELSTDYCPAKDDAISLLKQKIRLPRMFNYRWNQTISELKSETLKYLQKWQEDANLKGELFLLMDENRNAELVGYKVSYSGATGLEVEIGGKLGAK
jgi:CRISPR-associated endonuclease/helicase Cas3